MEKIFDGLDRAQELGFSNYKDWTIKRALDNNKKWNGIIDKKTFLIARIDWGRWICDCPCGNATLVTDKEPFVFCSVCGNEWAKNSAVSVKFPKNKAEIEAELLLRPITPIIGLQPTQAAIMSKPIIPGLGRDWNGKERIEDLKQQRIDLTLRVTP